MQSVVIIILDLALEMIQDEIVKLQEALIMTPYLAQFKLYAQIKTKYDESFCPRWEISK